MKIKRDTFCKYSSLSSLFKSETPIRNDQFSEDINKDIFIIFAKTNLMNILRINELNLINNSKMDLDYISKQRNECLQKSERKN